MSQIFIDAILAVIRAFLESVFSGWFGGLVAVAGGSV